MFFKKQKRPESGFLLVENMLREMADLQACQSSLEHENRVLADLKGRVMKTETLETKVSMLVAQIERSTTQTVQALSRSREQKIERAKVYRAFQSKHGINRPVQQPDLFNSAMMIGIFWLVEGLTGGALFIADGAMGVLPAITTGCAIAGVNMIMASMLGYFTRYFSFGLKEEC